ncbi:MAG: BamA/TamA family outer membrane protein [Gammaproteobacteria bacterium]|nr:BamA/TamA family outer membrane protein [Gammaproteobacteria bacterium]
MRRPTGLRILGACALAAFVANVAVAAKFTDRQRTRIEEPRPAGVPSDARLVASGAVIGKIDIITHNIFNLSDPRDDVPLFRLANRLHIRTRDSTIRAQLLFATGQKYRPRLLAETERNLRQLPFIYDAHVVPVRYAHGKVEIAVITKDVWTLSPGINFSRTGGANNSSVELSDSNFLGRGKSLDFQHGRNVDRSSNTLEWSDPNVLGSRWTDALAYADSSDGRRRALDVEHPFYSLETRWSVSASAQQYQRAVSRYAYGNIGDQFEDSEHAYALSGGVSAGLVRGWTRRWIAGAQYDRNEFLVDPTTSLPARVLPAAQTLAYPYVGFELIQDDYRKTGDLNQIGRTEDLYFGLQAGVTVGYSTGAFGASQRAIIVTGNARKGFQIDPDQQLFASADFRTRIEQGRARNLIADAAARYYWRWLPEWVLYAGVSGMATDALDPQAQLTIGGDSGLRGYPLRYEAGSSKALFTVEQRFYTDWFPFRLVRVGGAIFADAGRAWGPAIIGGNRPGMLEDVGFGLRLGNTRSGLGNVLHIDFAFPLNAPPGVSRFQVLVQTLQSF